MPQAAIAEAWHDEGFVPQRDLEYTDPSVRRWTFESYAAGVNWSEASEVDRALRAFASLVRWRCRQPWHHESNHTAASCGLAHRQLSLLYCFGGVAPGLGHVAGFEVRQLGEDLDWVRAVGPMIGTVATGMRKLRMQV